MKNNNGLFKQFVKLVFFIAIAASIVACSFDLPKSWEEEVLLHDGTTILAKRRVSFKGSHAIDQRVPIGTSTISFKLPGTNKTISWTSEYAKDLGRTDFQILALHILNSTPYIVTSPNGCTSYNKWGRPNPPYIFFKYDSKQWQRIPLAEFPEVFKTINIHIDLGNRDLKMLTKNSPVSAKYINKKNKKLRGHPEYKNILREPKNMNACKVLVRTETGWATPSRVEMKKKSKIRREKELERRRKAAESADKK